MWVTQGSIGTAAANLPWIPGTEATGRAGGAAVLVRGGGFGVMRPGLSRDRVSAPPETIIPVPEGLDMASVAALPVAGVTAWQCVHKLGRVTESDRVLVSA